MIDGSYSIFGFGNLAHVIAKFLAAQNILVESFIVEDSFHNGDVDGNANCLSVSEFVQKKDFMKKRVVFAVGYRDPKEKQLLFNRLDEVGINFVNLIFSKNYFINDDNIGRGNIFFPEAMIEPSVQVGNGNVFWSRAHICHDTVIGDFNFFATNSVIGGETKIGNRNFFALGSTIRNGICIDNDVCIGMGSVVAKSIRQPGTYIGSPAKFV